MVTARLAGDIVASVRHRSMRVLVYHSISDDSRDPFAVPPSLFAEQIAAIVGSGVPVRSCAELLDALDSKRAFERGVCITVDDGLDDFARNGVPALERHALPSTLFVSPGLVGESATWANWSGPRRFLDWDELRELQARRVDIGSHTQLHRHLTALTEAELVHELEQSRQELIDHLPAFVDAVAYPYGDQDEQVRVAASAAGYRAGFGVGGLWGNRAGIDRFDLRRSSITRQTSPDQIAEILRSADDWRRVRARMSMRSHADGSSVGSPS